MAETLFFRLLACDDKAAALAAAIATARDGRPPNPVVNAVDPASFRQVPGSPFAYWVSGRIQRLFTELPPFESEGRKLRLGDHPSDDFRYLRLFWEVPARAECHEWPPYYKGSDNSAFFDETRLVVDWDSSRQTYRDFFGRRGRSSVRPSNYQYFLLAGLTFPNRPHRRGWFSHVPPGGIFGHTNPMIQLPRQVHWMTCALVNSQAFATLLHLLMARGTSSGQTLKYEVGYVRSVPIPAPDTATTQALTQLAERCFLASRTLSTSNETSHVFHLPAILQLVGGTLAERITTSQARVADAEQRLAKCRREIDEIAFRLYGIKDEDRRAIESSAISSQPSVEEPDDESESADDELQTMDQVQLTKDFISYAIGCVLCRWDLRYATGDLQPPELPDPFAPLPVCSPGMLQGPDGLPLRETPAGYPLRIDWDGILVDDPEHPDDIIRRVREVLELVWKDRAEAIEQEACEILGVKELRDYFRKPGAGGFWDDHVKRYSKSRRKAPIYWLLQSSKKNYALWLYYHRLDKDILFKALVNYVVPKIQRETNRLDELRRQKQAAGESGRGAKKLDKDLERRDDLISELRDFEDKLRRTANLHLEPDLNDGVVLNIAPLHELVPWKEAKNYWDELLEGKYEWSSITKQLRKKGLVS